MNVEAPPVVYLAQSYAGEPDNHVYLFVDKEGHIATTTNPGKVAKKFRAASGCLAFIEEFCKEELFHPVEFPRQ